MFNWQTPPPPPAPDRRSALMHLLHVTDFVDASFFIPSRIIAGNGEIGCNFQGLQLRVKKRTLSDANPANVVYEVNLGALMPQNSKPLLAYVLHPSTDAEANRAAFRRCLEDLARWPAKELSEMEALA
ncbi:hypothetical protein V8D89_005171 [Ganoderma adspersum]